MREHEVELRVTSDFDLEKTFECGQCFRWNADENGVYTGVAQGRAARIRQERGSIFISGTINEIETTWHDYFDLKRDYKKIREQLSIDDFMLKATEYGEGIRLLRQDKWETLCSFILSQRNNIPRIKQIIDTLCAMYGDKIHSNGTEYYDFPPAKRIAALSEKDLEPIKSGYRAKYIIEAAKAIAGGNLNLDALSQSTQEHARRALKQLHGVGDKVADCVLLFGLNMLDAFPKDVWVNRAIATHYKNNLDPAVFSPYAGIAQQYIFHYIRNKPVHHG